MSDDLGNKGSVWPGKFIQDSPELAIALYDERLEGASLEFLEAKYGLSQNHGKNAQRVCESEKKRRSNSEFETRMSVLVVQSSIPQPKASHSLLTQKVIEDVRNMESLELDRPLKLARTRYLRTCIMGGATIPFIVHVADVDGVPTRLNGQHSSNILTELYKEAEEQEKVGDSRLRRYLDGLTLTIYHYGDIDHKTAVQIWKSIDARQSVRTANEVFLSSTNCNTDFESLKDLKISVKRTLSHACSMYAGAISNEFRKYLNTEGRLLVMSYFLRDETLSKIIATVAEHIAEAEKHDDKDKAVGNIPVVAAMLFTSTTELSMSDGGDKHRAFWEAVITTQHIAEEDPRLRLSRMLFSLDRKPHDYKTYNEMFCTIITTWHKWLMGVKVSQATRLAKEMPRAREMPQAVKVADQFHVLVENMTAKAPPSPLDGAVAEGVIAV